VRELAEHTASPTHTGKVVVLLVVIVAIIAGAWWYKHRDGK
jgi:hypothetical protein